MIIIGITGSIGMGKTTIASMFNRLNIKTHDSDQTVKKILSEDLNVINKIKEKWPSCFNCPENINLINKVILSNIVFKNKSQKKKLESIIHPYVLKSRNIFIKKHLDQMNKFVGLDVPLLYETETDKICNYVFLAYSSKKIQKERVMKRKNMTIEKFEDITNSQMSDYQKMLKNPILIRTDYGKIFTFILIFINLVKIILIENNKK